MMPLHSAPCILQTPPTRGPVSDSSVQRGQRETENLELVQRAGPGR